jgi:hypothetical protein
MGEREHIMGNSTTSCAVEPERVPRILHVLLVEGSRWEARAVRALWCACLASDKPVMARFVEATARASNAFGLKSQDACDRVTRRYLRETLTGRFLIDAVEDLCAAGTLDRKTATALQERILTSMDKHGRWKI